MTPKLRTELLQADVILPSLDAASQSSFEKITRPDSNKYLGALEVNNKIETVQLERGIFYELKHK